MTELSTRPVAQVATAVLLVLAPQLLGGVAAWSISVILGMSVLAYAACHYQAYGAEREKLGWDPLMWAMLACLAWTAVQAMPMPCAIVGWIAPDAAGHVAANAKLLGVDAGACHLSRDPGATRLEVLKGLAIVQAFLCGRWLARLGARRAVYASAAASSVAMMLIALGHWGAQATSVFGFYEPKAGAGGLFIAPLINPNTLGGFLAMGVPVCLGMAAERSDAVERQAWRGAAILLSATAVLTLSRGAAIALIVGPALFGMSLLIRARRQRSGGARTSAAIALGTMLLGVGVAIYVGLGVHEQELVDTDASKLAFIAEGLRFSLDHALLGVGRGGFASVFADLGDSTHRAFHPENLVVQWASEWGWPMALLLLTTLLSALARTLREGRPATLGATCGLLAVGIQNLVDLGLELLGVAVVAAALLGAVSAHRSQRPRHQHRTRALLGLPAVGVLAVVMAGLHPGEHTYGGQVELLRGTLAAGRQDAFARHLHVALADHPQEPVFPLLAAAEGMAQRPTEAGRWLNRSMSLAPNWVEPHVQAAFWLAQMGRRDQAMLELRAAARMDTARAVQGLCRLVGNEPNAREVLRAAPDGNARGPFLDSAISRCLTGSAEVVKLLDEDLRVSAPGLYNPRRRNVHRLIADKRPREALEAATALRRQWPNEPTAHSALALAHLADGDSDRALEVMRAAVARWPSDRGLLGTLARLAAAGGDPALMRATMATMMGYARGSAEVSRLMLRLGYHEQQLGNVGHAITAFRQAAEATEVADAVPALRQLAALSESSGRVSSAVWAHRRICELRPGDERACAAQARLLNARSTESAPKPRN